MKIVIHDWAPIHRMGGVEYAVIELTPESLEDDSWRFNPKKLIADHRGIDPERIINLEWSPNKKICETFQLFVEFEIKYRRST